MQALRYRDAVDAVLGDPRSGSTAVTAWQHQPIADQDAQTMADATIRFQARHDCDIVKLSPASSYQVRDFGMTDHWAQDVIGRRTYGEPIAMGADAWLAMAEMPAFLHRDIQVRAAALVRGALDPAVPMIATVFSPFFIARTVAGDRWADELVRHPSEVRSALRCFTDATVDLVDRLFEAGVEGIFYAAQYASADLTSATEYEHVALAHDVRCFDAIRDAAGLAVLHLHGDGVHLAPLIESVHPHILSYDKGATEMSAAEIADRFNVVVATGPGSIIDPLGPDASTVEHKIRSLRGEATDRSLIIAPGCTMPMTTPPLLIDTMINAARTPL